MGSRIPSHPVIWWSRLKHKWPLLIWLAAILAACHLYSAGIDLAPISGVVRKNEETVAPIEPGRLVEVNVSAGARVRKGQKLAQMDISVVAAEILIEQALVAEAEDTITGYMQNILRVDSEFRSAIAATQATLGDEKRNYEAAKAELTVIKKELSPLIMQAEARLIPRSTISLQLARMAALEKEVELYPKSIANLEERLVETQVELARLEHQLGGGASKAIDEKLKRRKDIHKQQLELLTRRAGRYTLRASRNGVVARVFQQVGDIVGPETPVLSIVGAKSSEVTAFVPEGRAHESTNINVTAYIKRRGVTQRFKATVVAVAPDIVWLPFRVSPSQNAGQGARGRRVTLKVTDANCTLIPGETVDVYLHGPTTSWLPKWLSNRSQKKPARALPHATKRSRGRT